MKHRLLLSLLFLFISISAFSQIGKGQKYLGGSLYVSYDQAGTYSVANFDSGYTQYNNSNILNLSISPDFGFFISDKWTLGIRPSYIRVSGTERSDFYSTDLSTVDYSTTSDYHSDFAGLSVELRYYWMLSDKFAIYPQFGIGTSHDLSDFGSGTFSIGGGPNVVFFPTRKLGINMGFGNINYNYGYATKASAFNLGINTNINFGVNYYYGGK